MKRKYRKAFTLRAAKTFAAESKRKQEEQEEKWQKAKLETERAEERRFEMLVKKLLKTKVRELAPVWEREVQSAIVRREGDWTLVVYSQKGPPSLEDRALHQAALRYFSDELKFSVKPVAEHTRTYHAGQLPWYTLLVIVRGW